MLEKPRAIPSSAHFAILAASGPSERERILDGARAIEARGHRVTIANNIDVRHRGYLAGNDDERVAEVNRFLRDPQYDAYLFARGGYGAMRILDRIDYAALAENPRPLIGFSDVTAIHQALAVKANLASFHGPMVNLDFRNGLSEDIEEWFYAMLRGDAPLTRRFARDEVLFEGEAEGTLFGGCLALTAALLGTPYDYWIDGGIWFWEDVDEPVYRIDRMLTHLWLSGRMHRVRAVVIGALKDCGNRADLMEFLHEFFGPLQIPVVYNLPFGHHGNNLMMPIGRTVRLDTANHTFTVIEPAVIT